VFRGPIRDGKAGALFEEAKAGAFAYATGKAGRLIERGEIHRLAKKKKFSIEGTFCLMHTISGV
jgi:hypothetical protein